MNRKIVGMRWLFPLVAMVIMLGSIQPLEAVSRPKIKIVHADFSPPVSQLLATGLFDAVDLFNAVFATPTLSDLTPYDAVLAYTNNVPSDGVALGNVLADYVDAGGRLVLATYAFSKPWSIKGRITTSGYSPLVDQGINTDVSGTLVPAVPDDPIFAGVNLGSLTYFHNSNFSHPGLDTGAILLATDGSGTNMIARDNTGQVIGLNLFPGTCCGGNNNQFYQLLANALARESTVEADLALIKTASPDPVEVGQHLTYTLTVTNIGPAAASGVVLTDALPADVTFVSASSTQGTCSGTSSITCQLETINNGANAAVTIVTTPMVGGAITNTASVTSDVADPDLTNNSATVSTTVWSLLLSDGTNSLGVNTDTGDFTLTYMVDGVAHTCSGTHARVDEGFLTITDRCTEDRRDTIRAAGPTDGSITVELIDQTGPSPSDRVIRHFTLTPLSTGPTCVQPPEGLVSWWPGDGDAKDLIGGNDGTLQNGATFGAGLVGQAFSFDGVDDYFLSQSAVQFTPDMNVSVDFWLKITGTNNNRGLVYFGRYDGDQGIFSLGFYTGSDDRKLCFRINGFGTAECDTAGELLYNAELSPNEWHHVAATYDHSRMTIYVDGQAVASKSFSQDFPSISFPLRLGTYFSSGFFFNGLMDEVSLYNRALSAAEIQAIFNARSAGKCKIIRVLGIDTGSSWAYSLVPFLSRVTFTKVSPADFATVDLKNFDVLLVSETFLDGSVSIPAQATLDALQARATELAAWLSAGHGVVTLAEPIGIGRFAWLPEAVRPTVGPHIDVDTVHIVNPTHPVMAGLTDDGLSGWGAASHGNFTSAGGLDVLVNDGGARPITLAGTFGRGKIVLTDQDPDFHHHFGTVKPDQVTLVQNALTWAATSAASVAELALTGCTSCHRGDQLALTATITQGLTSVTADVYIAIQLPDQSLFFLQADGSLTREPRPIVADWHVRPFRGEIFRYAFSGEEPAGRYTWLMAFVEPRTTRITGRIAQAAFTFSP